MLVVDLVQVLNTKQMMSQPIKVEQMYLTTMVVVGQVMLLNLTPLILNLGG